MQKVSHCPGERYAPECQAERTLFVMGFCSRCVRGSDPDDSCGIQNAAAMHSIDSEDYPAELTYDSYGRPTCTAFERVGPAPERCAFTPDLFS